MSRRRTAPANDDDDVAVADAALTKAHRVLLQIAMVRHVIADAPEAHDVVVAGDDDMNDDMATLIEALCIQFRIEPTPSTEDFVKPLNVSLQSLGFKLVKLPLDSQRGRVRSLLSPLSLP